MNILYILGIFVLPIGTGFPQATEVPQTKLKVSVYYETLCPFTKHFMKKQLFPVYAKMPEYLNLDFVPYGNTKTKTRNGTVNYRCPHGRWECFGNKLHACVISLLEPEVSNRLIYCTMTQRWPPTAGPRCASKHNVSFALIKHCAESEVGTLLMRQNEARTKALKPTLAGVPWVTIDDVWRKSDDDRIDFHFLEVVCKHLRNRPLACNQTKSAETIRDLSNSELLNLKTFTKLENTLYSLDLHFKQIPDISQFQSLAKHKSDQNF
ncbi:unnamed protein product [Allacma fusca]|uniref:Uncharacterized protein n=1 Tax=Allacma fusca TaxID=39272 RepID=A0A8J2PP21_9HEXA|nr:unnamed protein product [Allacma fusca]